jgi:hypothetical protein
LPQFADDRQYLWQECGTDVGPRRFYGRPARRRGGLTSDGRKELAITVTGVPSAWEREGEPAD